MPFQLTELGSSNDVHPLLREGLQVGISDVCCPDLQVVELGQGLPGHAHRELQRPQSEVQSSPRPVRRRLLELLPLDLWIDLES